MGFRASLMAWFKRHAERPRENLTQLSDFRPKMVGTRGNPLLKTKGAETFGLLHFLLHIVPLYGNRLGEHWQRIQKAGECLRDIVSIWSAHEWRLPPASQQVCRGATWDIKIMTKANPSIIEQ